MLLPPLTDYARDSAAYRRPAAPATFNYCDVIDGYAEDPTREALIWLNAAGVERRLTFAEVRDGSKRIAAVLRAQGIGRGDRVLIMLPRLPEWQLAMMAVFRIGAIAIPCITMLTPKDLAYRIAELPTPEPAGEESPLTSEDAQARVDGLVRTLDRVLQDDGQLI